MTWQRYCEIYARNLQIIRQTNARQSERLEKKKLCFTRNTRHAVVAETNITFLGLSMRTKKKLNVFTMA